LEQLIKTVVLGIIQGFTEWLPISSSGHLNIAEKILGMNVPLIFDVILHLATLTVIMLFFRNDVKNILSALIHLDFETEYGNFIPIIVVGTLPTAILGLAFSIFLENVFQDALTLAFAFIVCGTVLYSTRFGEAKTSSISFFAAFTIGIAQGIAVIPGLSRSGLTISLALLLGIEREKAFKFSFLLSIPAVIGAFGLTFYRHFGELTASGLGLVEISAGASAAAVIGYLALKLLWRILSGKKFHVFAFYCWMAGAFILLAFALGVL